MAYKKGELRYGPLVVDAREEDGYSWKEDRVLFYFPHSCQQWVIGGPEQVRLLVDDLLTALFELKNNTIEVKNEYDE